LVWARTFLLGVGLTDLGHFGRYFGQNKEIVSVLNGSPELGDTALKKGVLADLENMVGIEEAR
jgi:hypothetical protein